MKAPSWSAETWIKLAIVAGLAIALVVFWQFLPVREWMRTFIDYADSAGWEAYILFLVIYTLSGALGFPRTLLNIAGGIVFDFWAGFAIVMASTMVTASITFLAARHFAHEWVERRIDRIPNAKRIIDTAEDEGAKLVMLLRMNPFVPGVLKDYGFGTTDISFIRYFVASLIGSIPITMAHVYFGWIGGEAMIAEQGLPEAFSRTLLMGGLLGSALLVALLLWISHRALHRRTASA